MNYQAILSTYFTNVRPVMEDTYENCFTYDQRNKSYSDSVKGVAETIGGAVWGQRGEHVPMSNCFGTATHTYYIVDKIKGPEFKITVMGGNKLITINDVKEMQPLYNAANDFVYTAHNGLDEELQNAMICGHLVRDPDGNVLNKIK